MEDGTFETSVRSVLDMDEIIEKIPLPNQLPAAPDLTRLPPEALRSSAVETLLGQNADLMARLGVALRKNGILDTKINELEKENLHVRHRYDSVKDSVLVAQEKERLLTQRNSQLSFEMKEVCDRLTLLERNYTDTYLQAKVLEQQLRRFRNYRARVQMIFKKLKTRARRLANLVNPDLEKTESVTRALESAEQELRSIGKQNAETQLQLVSRYETEISNIRKQFETEVRTGIGGENERLKKDLELALRRAADRDLLYEAKIRFENQLIFEERQARLYREETQKDLQSLKEENLDLRGQLKARLIELERLSLELKLAEDSQKQIQTEHKNQIDQVESLQLLWREKQTELERIEEKNRNLQKLNQQLSVSLNAQRKEILDLNQDLEKDRYAATEKIHALEMQLTSKG